MTTKPTHTPGPWRVEVYEPAEQSTTRYRLIEVWASKPIPRRICTMQEPDADDVARLIAAAPELLDSLRELHDYLRERGSVKDTLEMLKRSHDAIEKASR